MNVRAVKVNLAALIIFYNGTIEICAIYMLGGLFFARCDNFDFD